MKIRKLIILLTISIYLLSPTTQYQKCNKKLLTTYKLQGMDFAIPDGMHICPHVKERCCSLLDEIRILQLWNQGAKIQLETFASEYIRHIEVFLEFYENFSEIDGSKFIFHYVYFSRVKYLHKYCSQTSKNRKLSKSGIKNQLNLYFPGGGPITSMTRNKTKFFPYSAFDNESEEIIKKDVNILIQNLKIFYEAHDKGRKLTSDNPKIFKEYLKIQKKEKKKIKNDFNHSETENNIKLFFGEETVKFLKSKKGRKLFDNYLQKERENELKKQNMEEKNDLDIQKKTKNSKKTKNQSPNDRNLFGGMKMPNIPQQNNNNPEMNFLKQLEKQIKLPKIFLPLILPLNIPKIQNSKIQIFTNKQTDFPYIKCKSRNRYFPKPIVMMNKKKLKYCKTVLKEFKGLNIEAFRNYMPSIKNKLNGVLQLKKSLYCSLCNADQQKYFDKKNSLVIYQQDFCRDVLVKYKDYLYFKNILLVEYLDTLLQIIHCQGGSGNEYRLPFLTPLTHKKRRIYFIKRCFENLDNNDFYKYCRFACVQYSSHQFSKFFEGDLSMMRKLFFTLAEYLRKNEPDTPISLQGLRLKKEGNSSIAIDNQNNDPSKKKTESSLSELINLQKEIKRRKKNTEVDDFSINPNDISSFRLSQQLSTAKYIKAKLLPDRKPGEDVLKKEVYRESLGNLQIYHKSKKSIRLDEYRSFFIDNKYALNPIKDLPYINFKFNATTLLEQQVKKFHPKKISDDVVHKYFEATRKGINNFNHDVGLYIAPQPSKKKYRKKRKKIKKGKTNLRFNRKRFKKFKTKKQENMKWLNNYLGKRRNGKDEHILDQFMHKNPRFV